MGKQAKPKPANQKGEQRKHNPLTRGINTKKPDLMWDWSLLYEAVEEELPSGETKTFFVPKKPEELKRLKPPLDDLLIDWETEIQHYAIENQARIQREALATGGMRYSVYNEYADGARRFRHNLLVVETPRAANFAPKKRGRRNKENAAPTP